MVEQYKDFKYELCENKASEVLNNYVYMSFKTNQNQNRRKH
jgi:hypothetical protein